LLVLEPLPVSPPPAWPLEHPAPPCRAAEKPRDRLAVRTRDSPQDPLSGLQSFSLSNQRVRLSL